MAALDAAALKQNFKQIIANNHQSGIRKLLTSLANSVRKCKYADIGSSIINTRPVSLCATATQSPITYKSQGRFEGFMRSSPEMFSSKIVNNLLRYLCS